MAQLNSTIINGDLAVAGQINSGKGLVLDKDIVTNGSIIVGEDLTTNGNITASGDVMFDGGIKHPTAWNGAHSLTIYNNGVSRNEASIRYTKNSNTPGEQENSWVVGLNAGAGTTTDHFGWWVKGLGTGNSAGVLKMELSTAGKLTVGEIDVGTWINLNGANGTIHTNGSITAVGDITANTFAANSDARLKENIIIYKPEKSILELPIYKYDFINGAKNQIGCLAQDLQEICPEIVNENEDGYLGIQESKLIYLLLDEVKKLKAEIEELKK